MKKFLLLLPILAVTACSQHVTKSYQKVITAKKDDKEIVLKSQICEDCSLERLLNTRSLINGSEYLCDLNNKFYIIKSEYRSGLVAIEQQGYSCKYHVEEIMTVYPAPGTPDNKKISIKKFY